MASSHRINALIVGSAASVLLLGLSDCCCPPVGQPSAPAAPSFQEATPTTPGAPAQQIVLTPTEAPAPSPIPWLGTVIGNCGRYRAAPNEIQKSAIFRENERFITGKRLIGVQGTLATLSTDQGGGSLDLEVDVGEDVEFRSDPLNSIPSGSSIYRQASTLTEGQCVIISATVLEASSVMEESKVCDPEYVVNFTSIRGCT